MIERENYKKLKSDGIKQLQFPPEKEKVIKEALKYFVMIRKTDIIAQKKYGMKS